MQNISKTISLEEEMNTLLSNYQSEEISFYKEIVAETDIYQAENMVVCSIVTTEDGSNG